MVRNRWLIWGIIALVVLAALILPDLTGNAPHPNIAMRGERYVAGIVSGALLASFLDPDGRFDATVELHCWVRRYAVPVLVQGGVELHFLGFC